MPGMFIDVQVDEAVAKDPAIVKKLVEVCPVNIFAQHAGGGAAGPPGHQDDGTLRIVEENLDECVLCDLCVRAAPEGTVRILKLYES
jgi:NAD-dependent dihydropyrimidine dehydrogenase PreA subunit